GFVRDEIFEIVKRVKKKILDALGATPGESTTPQVPPDRRQLQRERDRLQLEAQTHRQKGRLRVVRRELVKTLPRRKVQPDVERVDLGATSSGGQPERLTQRREGVLALAEEKLLRNLVGIH